jgi:hypothetical protein
MAVPCKLKHIAEGRPRKMDILRTLKNGAVGSNPTQAMDICVCV